MGKLLVENALVRLRGLTLEAMIDKNLKKIFRFISSILTFGSLSLEFDPVVPLDVLLLEPPPVDDLEGLLVRGLGLDGRRHPGLVRLPPAHRAQAPTVARLQAGKLCAIDRQADRLNRS